MEAQDFLKSKLKNVYESVGRREGIILPEPQVVKLMDEYAAQQRADLIKVLIGIDEILLSMPSYLSDNAWNDINSCMVEIDKALMSEEKRKWGRQ